VVAIRGGVCSGRELLSGPSEMGDGAHEANACRAAGCVRNFFHTDSICGARCPSPVTGAVVFAAVFTACSGVKIKIRSRILSGASAEFPRYFEGFD
jgi:hypothetical protein